VTAERRLIPRDRWHLTNTVSPQPITQKTNFLVDTLTLFPVSCSDKTSSKAHKINAGYHEWDFKFKMPSNLDQSVEGLPTNWVVYNLKATVDRGYMSKQLSASSHIRVIRTLGRDMLESMPMEQVSFAADLYRRAGLTSYTDQRGHLGEQGRLQDYRSPEELHHRHTNYR
jgi:hypothetical protein